MICTQFTPPNIDCAAAALSLYAKAVILSSRLALNIVNTYALKKKIPKQYMHIPQNKPFKKKKNRE